MLIPQVEGATTPFVEDRGLDDGRGGAGACRRGRLTLGTLKDEFRVQSRGGRSGEVAREMEWQVRVREAIGTALVRASEKRNNKKAEK